MTTPPPTPTHDEVDTIITAWQREIPTLDSSPMHVLSRLTRLNRRLELARKEAFDTLKLETWEFDVLAALRRAGTPHTLTITELIKDTLVTSGTMTNRIDKLQAAGLVERHPSPHDRRTTLITLTPTGKERVDNAVRALIEFEHTILAPLNTDERNTLAHLLRTLLAPITTPNHNPEKTPNTHPKSQNTTKLI